MLVLLRLGVILCIIRNTLESITLTVQFSFRKQNKDCFFHLSLKKTGCNGYMYMPKLVDKITDADEQVPVDKELTVLVPSSAVDILRGTQVDFQQKQWGMSQLTFNHPKSAGVCGCGESFNFKEDDNDE